MRRKSSSSHFLLSLWIYVFIKSSTSVTSSESNCLWHFNDWGIVPTSFLESTVEVSWEVGRLLNCSGTVFLSFKKYESSVKEIQGESLRGKEEELISGPIDPSVSFHSFKLPDNCSPFYVKLAYFPHKRKECRIVK